MQVDTWKQENRVHDISDRSAFLLKRTTSTHGLHLLQTRRGLHPVFQNFALKCLTGIYGKKFFGQKCSAQILRAYVHRVRGQRLFTRYASIPRIKEILTKLCGNKCQAKSTLNGGRGYYTQMVSILNKFLNQPSESKRKTSEANLTQHDGFATGSRCVSEAA